MRRRRRTVERHWRVRWRKSRDRFNDERLKAKRCPQTLVPGSVSRSPTAKKKTKKRPGELGIHRATRTHSPSDPNGEARQTVYFVFIDRVRLCAALGKAISAKHGRGPGPAIRPTFLNTTAAHRGDRRRNRFSREHGGRAVGHSVDYWNSRNNDRRNIWRRGGKPRGCR